MHRQPRRSFITAALVAPALLLVSACQGPLAGGNQVQRQSQTVGVQVPSLTTGPSGASGTAYLLLGATVLRTSLTEVSLSTGRVTTVVTPTMRGGADAVSASALMAVIANGAGGIDALQAVSRGRLTSIPGLGPSFGSCPAVGPDGRIAWTQPTPGNQLALKEWDPRDRRVSVVLTQGGSFCLPAWGPGGRLAFLENPSWGTGLIVVIGAGGQRTVLAPAFPNAWQLYWSTQNLFAVQEGRTQTVIYDPTHRTEQTIQGWAPLGFTADGARLMLASDHAIAMVDAPTFTDIQVVMPITLTSHVFGGAWQP